MKMEESLSKFNCNEYSTSRSVIYTMKCYFLWGKTGATHFLPGCTLDILKSLWKLEQLLVFFLCLLCGETHYTIYHPHFLVLYKVKRHSNCCMKYHSLFGYVSAWLATLGSFLFPVTICCPPGLCNLCVWSLFAQTPLLSKIYMKLILCAWQITVFCSILHCFIL